MGHFTTGLNAIRTSTALMDIAGDNIANASTPGYHVKRADVVPVVGPTMAGMHIGIGSTVEDVARVRDELIERALLEHTQASERFSAELETLTHVELLFGEPSDSGISARLGEFFDSMDLLAGNPDDLTLREEAVQKAQALCDAFHRLRSGLDDIQENLMAEVEWTAGRINELTERIAEMNIRIRSIEASGTTAASLEDSRDRLITELAQLINISLYDAGNGVVNVSCSGTLLVSDDQNAPISIVQTDDGVIVRREGAEGHHIEVRDSRLGGLLSLLNDVVPNFTDDLDALAAEIRRAVNVVHTTGLGLEGRFTSLSGLNPFAGTDPFYAQGYGVTAGTAERLVVNVEDLATGEVTQHELTLDTTAGAAAFVTGLAALINSDVDHVTATVAGGRLSLRADAGYAFDFATPYDPNPVEPGDISAADPTSATILDGYAGEEDLTYRFTFLNDGEIGVDTVNVTVEVLDRSMTVLRTLTQQIGPDYDPGTALGLENGLRYSLSAGNVAAGDGFSFTAHASNDTAGVLDALGLNVVFTGTDASTINVAERLVERPSRLAGAISTLPADNQRFLALAAVRSAKVAEEGTQTLSSAYLTLVGAVGTARNASDVELTSQQELVKALQNRRDSVSGVSIDEEMVHLVEANAIYQGAAKYISLTNAALQELLDIV